IQTLGEEYTGTIRVDQDGHIPSKMVQTLWLILYIGGEPLLERLLSSSKNKISKSTALREEAKSFLLRCIDFIKERKSTVARIHQSIFYTNGKYYNLSNRLMGIRYVLLRQWLQDDTFTGSFNLLGHISLFYILFNFIHQLLFNHDRNVSENFPVSSSTSNRTCVLCAENMKSPCATTCGHVFCWTCIYESLSYQKSCPVCRENISSSRIIFLQNYT
ncbi:peroxisome biogenesis factor 10-like, partial [Anoplophora glabripennis]|uniref:peroxisome biogenesis factor 10-like n=1 Tax=Anoplophora glabripennis TaxID=217634 RepID=UPI000874B866